jgi:hypothetical protein
MIYRKAPPQPGRLLLRVVAMAGAGAVAGAFACSGSGDVQRAGFVSGAVDGGGHDGQGDEFVGGGSDAFMGFTTDTGGFTTDTGVSDAFTDSPVCEDGCGLVGNPDAESDVITGVVVHPDGGTDE